MPTPFCEAIEMKTHLMWLCGLIWGLAVSSGGHADTQDISARLAEAIHESRTPGVVYQEYHGENLIAHGKAGTRMLGQDSPISYGDVMHWGSMGKAQTALLCANLINAGALESFDVKLVDHVLPEQRDALLAKDRRYGLITLRMLLGMSSGIDDDMVTDDYSDAWLWSQYRYNLEPSLGRKLLVDELAKSYALSADPGAKYFYSNVGYTLAGYMAETAWNRKHPDNRMTYEALMRERLFKPLGITTANPGAPGMTSTYSGLLLPAGPTPVAIGHNMQDNNPAPHTPKNQPVGIGYRYADLPLVMTPAGLWAMTIGDMAKLERVYMQSKQTPLLDRVGVTLDLLKAIEEPHIKVQDQMYFTLGWLRDMSEAETVLMYQGSNERWVSTISINVAKQRMKIAGSNSGTEENGMFMRKLVQLSDGDPHVPPGDQ
ncbi:MAG: beta-lactamase family protein [Thiohalocapsa sp.]|jgi:CubicO group peptidase (beta-lactamase class C family)|uniref:serine hydrolase domain-containing protein n=1 Tax=Thiohalocapsa sp. TaxID=2497641 RepID=UPI0025EF1444|nr:serine hydrolase domain-containing protein [Thiohalocapsa sp.]MCG6939651.1 beta-lactamase family protein [Thiohalocapsa sp.]